MYEPLDIKWRAALEQRADAFGAAAMRDLGGTRCRGLPVAADPSSVSTSIRRLTAPKSTRPAQ